ncbi:hypothetical protein BH10PLA2_BH10PLA2_03270 [soil metagenome]
MRRCVTVILAVCVVAISGCGTCADFLGGPCGPVKECSFYCFRGVRTDIEQIKKGDVIFAVDVPFSAAADLVVDPPFMAAYLLSRGCKNVQSKLNDMSKAEADSTNSDQVANPQ